MVRGLLLWWIVGIIVFKCFMVMGGFIVCLVVMVVRVDSFVVWKELVFLVMVMLL